MADSMYLVPVAGPPMEKPLELAAKAGGITLGRHGDCDVHMPENADRVSRFHARFEHSDGNWAIVDLNSRWGTSVNGVHLAPETRVPLDEGDLIRFSPYMFVFSATPERKGGTTANQDEGMTIVRTIGAEQPTGVVDQMLQLLLSGAEQVHQSTDEKMLAERLMDVALRGTGMSNAAFLRAIDQSGRYEIVASKFALHNSKDPIRFSQSLIQAASGGRAAEIAGNEDYSQSIVQMNIGSALCVPLTIGSGEADAMVAAYLYLDSRGMMSAQLRPQTRDFCVALGRIASLSLANLKRIDIEKRQARLEAELKSAANVQSWMLPRRHTSIGSLTCIGESRFGQGMGGDFFDLIDLGNDRVAVTIGDVSGKGVTASVLMTATQGYLHAALRASGDPQLAIESAHAFISPRKPTGKFVTAWVGVIDLKAQTLRYVDAGHGYAVLRMPDGSCEHLEREGGGPPIGMIDEATYEAVEVSMPTGSGLLLMSDGIIEQFGMVRLPDGTQKRDQFEMAGVLRCMMSRADANDLVNCLFEELVKHAGSATLGDDATIVWIKS
jgi:serine phosphatase RsbU (regulator of sigma subunit)